LARIASRTPGQAGGNSSKLDVDVTLAGNCRQANHRGGRRSYERLLRLGETIAAAAAPTKAAFAAAAAPTRLRFALWERRPPRMTLNGCE